MATCWMRWAAICAMALVGGPLGAAPPKVLPTDATLDDQRLGPPRTLDSFFPFPPVSQAADWPARREAIRRRVLVAAGLWPLPTRPPLAATIHGRIDQGDYTIEKVFFESFPGHFVTGNLYRPAGESLHTGRPRDGRRAGVLCPHGHWPNGRFMDAGAEAAHAEIAGGGERFECGGRSPLQARCVGLARMGCVVFHYDMLGYADSVQFPEHRHGPPADDDATGWRLAGAAAVARLQSHFGVQTWNSVRALDFLCGLPDVDPARVAVTGASGGGTQTMILAAIDERVAAAFPCVMVSTAMQGGCPCENAALLRIGQGNIDIAAATAPRPLGLTAADDWTKELEQKGAPDLAALYRLLGVPSRFDPHYDIRFKHNYNAVSRSHCYRFLDREFALGNADAGREREFERLTADRLSVWDATHPGPTGDAVGPAHERGLCQWWADDARRQLVPLIEPADPAAVAAARRLLGDAFTILIGRTAPTADGIAFERSATQPSAMDGATIEAGLVHVTAHGERIPTLVIRPFGWSGEIAIWPHPAGKQGLFTADGDLSAPVQALLNRGMAVILADLFGQGESLLDGQPLRENPRTKYPGEATQEADRWRLDPCYFHGYNPSLFARRVHDLLALAAFARSAEGAAAKRLIFVGQEGAGHWVAATVAALRPWSADKPVVDQAVILTGGFRFANLTDAWHQDFLPGGVKYGDLLALVALSLPTRLAVHDPDPAFGGRLLAWATAAGCPDAVTMLPTADVGAALGGVATSP
jgi:hypothetical protein